MSKNILADAMLRMASIRIKTGAEKLFQVDGFAVPEKYRIKDEKFGGAAGFNHGAFSIPSNDTTFNRKRQLIVIASDGTTELADPQNLISQLNPTGYTSGNNGWCHVSVRAVINDNATLKDKVPSWFEMCQIKDLFWREDQLVVQYHPPKSDYVNTHKFVLHLWSCHEVELFSNRIPKPPINLV